MTEIHTTAPGATSDVSTFHIINLPKKHTRKRIRQLRKGKGKLTEKVADLLDELRADGSIVAGIQTVVVVVREKPKSRKLFGL
jgi:hypothetical protein